MKVLKRKAGLKTGLEIERKFLIKMPSDKDLQGLLKKEITQMYLLGGGRIRRVDENGKTTYFLTVKHDITHVVREENEREITEKEYNDLVLRSDPALSVIKKTRVLMPSFMHTFEIDIYEGTTYFALAEVELSSECEPYEIPQSLKVFFEVTQDKRFRNYSLAMSIKKGISFDDVAKQVTLL